MNLLHGRAALVAIVGLTIGGCGGDEVIDRSGLEKRVQTRLTEDVGSQAPKASCPDELKAKEGATTRCTMDFPNDQRLGITVSVTSAKDGEANLDFAADQKLTKTP